MKRKNIDPQARRKRDAVHSAVISSGLMLLTAAILLLLRRFCQVSDLGSTLLLIIAVINLGAMIPVWILLKNRIKEIEGGEEDAAAQY